jgi:colicin import membrane protein
MRTNWFQTSRSLFFSILLHIVFGGILIFSFKFSAKPTPVHKPVTNIIKAISVDKKQVELELKRLNDIEEAKKAEEKKRQKKLEKKAENAKKKRIAEEEKLKQLKKKKDKEEKLKQLKKKKDKEKKKKEAERKRKEEEKLKQLKKKKDKEKKKKEAERKRKEEEKLKAKEAERKRKEEEKKLKEKALQEELETEQLEYDQSEILKFTSLIINSIESKFNKINLKEGLSCKILIRMIEGGEVIESNIVESSGDATFDQRAEKAVRRASPLPVPTESRLFNKMRSIRITFEP